MSESNRPDTSTSVPGRSVYRRMKLWAFILAALLFASGAAAGWSGAQAWLVHVDSSDITLASQPDERLAERAARRLTHRLGLSDAQQQELQSALEHRVNRLSEIYATIEPELEEEFVRLEQQMRQILDDNQQRKWERLIEQQRPLIGRDGREPGQGQHRSGPEGRHRDSQPGPNGPQRRGEGMRQFPGSR